jgi:hypothetical protein
MGQSQGCPRGNFSKSFQIELVPHSFIHARRATRISVLKSFQDINDALFASQLQLTSLNHVRNQWELHHPSFPARLLLLAITNINFNLW